MDINFIKNIVENAIKDILEEKKVKKTEPPKFSLFSNDNKAKKEYKKSKEEPKEATGASSGGGYSPALSFKKQTIETNEATDSGSSGSYETAFFLAKNLKNWGPSKKPQLPGGMFVKPKEKCKTFPYCNQGDINAFEFTTKGDFNKKLTKKSPIRKKSKLKESIENVSYKTGLSEYEIFNILIDNV